MAAAVPPAQRRAQASRRTMASHESGLYLWSGQHVQRLFPGFRAIAADIYWIRTVQYFGSKRAFSKDRQFELLEPLTDITVTLDPRLEIAYRYGAIFLAEPKPEGAGRPASAVALLRRGIEAIPDNWSLRMQLGYYLFAFLNDAGGAARVLLEAADAGGPSWLRVMAADVIGRGGQRDVARRMWRQMHDHEEPGPFKTNAHIHLEILDSLDGREALQKKVDEFERRTGRRPRALEELLSAGLLAHPPVDPAGVPFAYDAVTGRVSVSEQSRLWRPDR